MLNEDLCGRLVQRLIKVQKVVCVLFDQTAPTLEDKDVKKCKSSLEKAVKEFEDIESRAEKNNLSETKKRKRKRGAE